MRLGYDAKENRERANYCRFNEAEAHAPRIHYPGRHTPAACRRFNEAEAHAPRIHASGHAGLARRGLTLQ